MTPKERVLKRWPEAFCELSEWTGLPTIYSAPFPYGISILGSAKTDDEAWSEAARRLEQSK